MAKFWRQGDLVFEQTERARAVDMEQTGVFAVSGETGHLHTVQVARMGNVQELTEKPGHFTIDQQSEALIQLDRETPVVHEQHATLLLPEGTYRVRHVGLPQMRMAD